MTREDIQGFVELLPVDDDSDLWDLMADFLAKETVKRLGDLDPKLVLEVLCKLPTDDKPEDEEPEDEESKDEESKDEEVADKPADPPPYGSGGSGGGSSY